MESLFRKIVKASMKTSIMGLALLTTACSQVSFNPADPNAAFEWGDGSQKESFSFDDDGSGAKVDVLFVVDNSNSMYEEQGRLGSALQSFITSIGNLDWQIGITNTDISNGPFGKKGSLLPIAGSQNKVLTKYYPNYAEAFAQTVVREETLTCDNTAAHPCGSPDERPLAASIMAMNKANTDNAGFFRPGADLAIVILSDEDEGSTGVNAVTGQAVVSAFAEVFGGTKTLSTYGIIIQPGDTACYNTNLLGGGFYGNSVSQLAQLTGGVTGSICAADFGPSLSSIGNRVRQMVKSVTLKFTPKPETVQIVIRPFDSSLTWQVTGNTITFSKTPKKGTKVDVVYLPL